MILLGIDFGNSTTVVATVGSGGVDVLNNDISNRLTPSMVTYTNKERHLGEKAKSAFQTHPSNTILDIKANIGEKNFDEDYIKRYSYKLDKNGNVSVIYQKKSQVLSYTQVLGSYFKHLLTFVSQTEVGAMIAVPKYFTPTKCHEIIKAGYIAGFKVVRLVEDLQACAFFYTAKWAHGIPENTTRTSLIIDSGEYDTSICLLHGTKTKQVCLYRYSQRDLGGKYYTDAIVKWIVEQYTKQTSMDPSKITARGYLRIFEAAEKAKRVLSINEMSTMSIYAVDADNDLSLVLHRDEFMAITAETTEKFKGFFEKTYNEMIEIYKKYITGKMCEKSEIHPQKLTVQHLEFLGGNLRVKAMKDLLTELYGVNAESTLGQDEGISKSSAFLNAYYYPYYKLCPVPIFQLLTDSIVVRALSLEENDLIEYDDDNLTLKSVGDIVPSSVYLNYDHADVITLIVERVFSNGERMELIKYSLTPIGEGTKKDLSTFKLRLRADIDYAGYVTFKSPKIQEKPISEEEQAKDKGSNPWIADLLKLEAHVPNSAVYPKLDEQIKTEIEMCKMDQMYLDTNGARNALEEYIYQIGPQISSTYVNYATDKEKAKATEIFNKAEADLDDNEDVTLKEYQQRLNTLKTYMTPILARVHGWSELFEICGVKTTESIDVFNTSLKELDEGVCKTNITKSVEDLTNLYKKGKELCENTKTKPNLLHGMPSMKADEIKKTITTITTDIKVAQQEQAAQRAEEEKQKMSREKNKAKDNKDKKEEKDSNVPPTDSKDTEDASKGNSYEPESKIEL